MDGYCCTGCSQSRPQAWTRTLTPRDGCCFGRGHVGVAHRLFCTTPGPSLVCPVSGFPCFGVFCLLQRIWIACIPTRARPLVVDQKRSSGMSCPRLACGACPDTVGGSACVPAWWVGPRVLRPGGWARVCCEGAATPHTYPSIIALASGMSGVLSLPHARLPFGLTGWIMLGDWGDHVGPWGLDWWFDWWCDAWWGTWCVGVCAGSAPCCKLSTFWRENACGLGLGVGIASHKATARHPASAAGFLQDLWCGMVCP